MLEKGNIRHLAASDLQARRLQVVAEKIGAIEVEDRTEEADIPLHAVLTEIANSVVRELEPTI